jgi:hypothetical protein
MHQSTRTRHPTEMRDFAHWLVDWLRAMASVTLRNRYSEMSVYIFAGIGLVYAVQMLMKGGV